MEMLPLLLVLLCCVRLTRWNVIQARNEVSARCAQYLCTLYINGGRLQTFHSETEADPVQRLFLRAESSIWWTVSHYRQDAAKRQTVGIVFTHRPKIRFFAPQGRLVAPIRVKLCRTNGHLGPLGCAKFHVYRCRGVGMRPRNIKNFHFLVKSRP